jgi:hypothetical protein
MGNEIVAARSAKLFSLNGHYSVPEDNSRSGLLDDAHCFSSSALEILRKEIMDFEDEGGNETHPGMAQRLWAVFHLIDLSRGAANAANNKAQSQV